MGLTSIPLSVWESVLHHGTCWVSLLLWSSVFPVNSDHHVLHYVQRPEQWGALNFYQETHSQLWRKDAVKDSIMRDKFPLGFGSEHPTTLCCSIHLCYGFPPWAIDVWWGPVNREISLLLSMLKSQISHRAYYILVKQIPRFVISRIISGPCSTLLQLLKMTI